MQNEGVVDGAASAVEQQERAGPSWERDESVGPVRRLSDTLLGSLFSPNGFFKQMRRTGGYLSPLVYGMILGSISTVVPIVWNVLLVSLRDVVLESPAAPQMFTPSPGLYALLAVLSPILVTLVAFLWSGVLHVLLLLVGGASHGFQATFRVVCYSRSAGVWHIVPFVGPLVGSVWYVVLLVVGLIQAHETSLGRALAAVLIPLVVWAVLLFGLVVAMSTFSFL
ncbi:MAG: YIP1 family protein [Candidatus Eiseniibacteriota bacterium]|nr:MAG: YIP1 family protein [Candidatus Eisenbacteria bacterium]